MLKFKSEIFSSLLNPAVLVGWNSQYSCTISLNFMCSSYQCKFLVLIVSSVCCLFFSALMSIKLFADCRVLKYIDASRKEVGIELNKLVKLCQWEHGKSHLSFESMKKSRQKLRKLIQKYTVSFRLSICYAKAN